MPNATPSGPRSPVDGAPSEDTARLDAIERGEVEIECMGTTHRYQIVHGVAGTFFANLSQPKPLSLREAIDAARASSASSGGTRGEGQE